MVSLMMGTWGCFQFRNEIFLSKMEEIKGWHGDDPWYAAQAIPPIDADIGQKDHLWMETK